jgi:hypothetical protein
MTRHRIRLIAFATSLICVYAINCLAQGSKQTSLPRIGEIKDYPATGLMTGCGNLYFFKAGTKMSDTTYVFLARGDGSNAWMNLNGRDVRLRQLKSAKRGQKRRGYSYVYGQTRVTIAFENVKPKADGSEPEHMFKMTITVRKGSAVRIIHAVGDSDC